MNTQNEQLTKEDFYTTIFSAKGMQEKRDLLKDMSNTAKLMLEINPDAGENVNDIIINKMYKGAEHTEFNTFKGWKEKGLIVKKGSKAFFIWSKPRKVEKKKDTVKEGDKDNYKMFGVAHLFSNSQVEPLKN
ncbi:ArdC-like ssDNA-binding domain-containing protein [Tenacibaculum maritimum]|uniref:ArdC-like ssDNA-binding domain-containing protein n=1 Tax=Tenacibaculum maritimum TaxID=107401 RepID=UPI003876FEA0